MSDIEKFAKEGVFKILVGNKSDLIDKRQVSKEKGKQLADSYGIPFIETSAKSNENIEKLRSGLFLRLRSFHGANARACAAFDALVRIDDVLAVLLGNRLYGTFAFAGTAADAVVGNFVSHYTHLRVKIS